MARGRRGFRAEVVERARCGDGLASTADRVCVALRCAEPSELPERVILKTILLHRALRFGLPTIRATARVLRRCEQLPGIERVAGPALFASIGLYQRVFPHAPEPMYANEVGFYRELRPGLDIEAPRSFAAAFDPDTRSFAIVMEDLRLRGASFPNATASLDPPRLRALIDGLARLHAEFWASPRLDAELAWVPTTTRGGMFPVFDGIGFELIRDQLRQHPFKRELIAPLGRSLDELWAATWRAQERFAAECPRTLCHGDAHVGNSYALADGGAGLLDWQLMVRGCWAHDLAYLLITALDPDSRRAQERALLDYYLERLAAAGLAADRRPSTEEAWLRYRQGMIWGLVIGWLITPPQNYGVEITAANISRVVTAMRDHGSLELIP